MGITNAKGVDGSTITYGNRSSSKAELIGDVSGTVCNKHGQEVQKVKLEKVKYVPNSKYNLFSVTKRVDQGYKIGGDKINGLFPEKNGHRIVFDIIIDAGSGLVACIYLKRNVDVANVAADNNTNDKLKKASSTYSKTIPIKLPHDLFGHCDEARTRKMAEAQGFKFLEEHLDLVKLLLRENQIRRAIMCQLRRVMNGFFLIYRK